MRIALVIPTLHKGGAEKIASILSKELSRFYDVYIILFENKISYEYKGQVVCLNIPLTNSVFEGINIIRRALMLKQIAKEKGIDVFISFDESASFSSIMSSVRTIATIHKSLKESDKEKGFLKKIATKMLRHLYKKASVVCVSKGIADELKGSLGIDAKVIYNPHDIKVIRKKAEEKSSIKLPKKYILNIGRMEKQKAQWDLINAFKKLNTDVKLVIVGRGSLEKDLRAIANEDVVFMTEWVDNIYFIIKHCQFFALSSYFEGFPNVLVESIALGKPIVSTDCRHGPKEVLGKELEKRGELSIRECGILVPVGNVNALARAMELLLNNKKLYKRLSKNAFRRAELFDKRYAIKQYLEVIRSIV